MTDPVKSTTRSTGRRLLMSTLTMIMITSACLTGYLLWRSSPADTLPTVTGNGDYVVGSLPTTDTEAVTSAASATADLLSYDYRSLAEAPARVHPHLTAEYAVEYGRTFQTTVSPMAANNKAVVNALVRGAGIIDRTDDRARCLVFVDQVLISGAGSTAISPEVEGPSATTKVVQHRILVSLTRNGTGWLVSGLSPF